MNIINLGRLENVWRPKFHGIIVFISYVVRNFDYIKTTLIDIKNLNRSFMRNYHSSNG